MHRLELKDLKWAFGTGALAVVLFGCAGNSVVSTGTTATTASTATTATTATTSGTGFAPNNAKVNLADVPASVRYAFLTGAGRAGDVEVASVRSMEVIDNLGTESSSIQARNLTLTAFESQQIPTTIGLRQLASRKFDQVNLNIFEYRFVSGTVNQTFNAIEGAPALVSADVRVFNGRSTLIPIYLDPEVINIEQRTIGGLPVDVAVFDPTRFDAINRIPSDTVSLRSYVSDYVCFDVSAMPTGSRPLLTNGQRANRIFFSGDGYAMGAGDPANGGTTGAPFELVLPEGQGASIIGRYSAPALLPGGIAGSVTPGSYTTLGADPTDLSTVDPSLVRKITNFQGEWRNHFSQRLNPTTGAIEELGYFRDPHAFEAFSIPGSDDSDRQDVMFMTQTVTTNPNGTKSVSITNLFWGFVDLGSNTFSIFPLSELPTAEGATGTIPGEIRGRVTGKFTSSGTSTVSEVQTRYVQFEFIDTPPAGMPTNGFVVVLRR